MSTQWHKMFLNREAITNSAHRARAKFLGPHSYAFKQYQFLCYIWLYSGLCSGLFTNFHNEKNSPLRFRYRPPSPLNLTPVPHTYKMRMHRANSTLSVLFLICGASPCHEGLISSNRGLNIPNICAVCAVHFLNSN